MKAERKALTLKDHAQYSAALAKLEELNAALAEKLRDLEARKARAVRVGADAKRYIGMNVPALASTSDEALDAIAAKVVSSCSIPRETMAAIRSGISAAHAKVTLTNPDDLDQVAEIREAQEIVRFFERAVSLHKREIVRLKKIASTEVCNSLGTERERIARAVARALAQFAAALHDEYELADRLRLQDDAMPALLSPPPFPSPILSDPAVLQWVAKAVGIPLGEVPTWLKNPGSAAAA